VPDAVRGEIVAAFVILHDATGATTDDLQRFCRDALASYKVPRHVFVITDADVPRTGTGKVAKPALRELAQRLLA
jgi:fatty-acyl-CoA synthase